MDQTQWAEAGKILGAIAVGLTVGGVAAFFFVVFVHEKLYRGECKAYDAPKGADHWTPGYLRELGRKNRGLGPTLHGLEKCWDLTRPEPSKSGVVYANELAVAVEALFGALKRCEFESATITKTNETAGGFTLELGKKKPEAPPPRSRAELKCGVCNEAATMFSEVDRVADVMAIRFCEDHCRKFVAWRDENETAFQRGFNRGLQERR